MPNKTKIEKVESMLVGGADGSPGEAHLVRIWTEDGTYGVGQSSCWAYNHAADVIAQKAARYLVGQDPSRIEHHWQYMYRMGPFRGSALSGAISAIDIALWDIKGKRLGVPVWDLLGGNTRDKVRLHLLMGPRQTTDLPFPHDRGKEAHGLYVAAKESAEEGWTAIKTDPLPDGFQSMTLERLISDTVDNVAAMREGAGKDVDIILEIHRKLTPMNAIALAQELEQFHPSSTKTRFRSTAWCYKAASHIAPPYPSQTANAYTTYGSSATSSKAADHNTYDPTWASAAASPTSKRSPRSPSPITPHSQPTTSSDP